MYEEYTNKQIYEALCPKLRKMGWDVIVDSGYVNPKFVELVGTLYRSAYIRGERGRSFIIGSDKKPDVPGTKWVSAKNYKLSVGDKVRYAEPDFEGDNWYPETGTIGYVEKIDDSFNCWVQWPKGSTSKDDCWCVADCQLEVEVCK